MAMTMASMLQVLLVAASLAGRSSAEDANDFGFGADVAKHFVMPPAPDHVHEIAADSGKPVMAILMNKVSPICNALKKAIKKGSKVKALLDSFTVAYAEESIDKWTDDKYVPQVIFFYGSEKLSVESGHKSGKYLYADETKLEAAMVKALAEAKAKQAAKSSSRKAQCMGGKQCAEMDDKDMCEFTDGCTWAKPEKQAATARGCSGGAECAEMDDKDMCEFTDGCTWSAGGDGSGPCQGGAQCNDMDDKDICEFTDGCTWHGEEEDDFEDNDDAGSGGSGGADHTFRKEIADKLLVDQMPPAVKSAAKKAKKPFMVLLTQEWCGPCKELIKSINAGTAVKELMDSFVIAHSTGDNIHQWQAEGANYVPQVYFYSEKGKLLDVPGPNDKFKYFFETEDQVVNSMKQALRKVAKEGGEL